MNENKQAAHTSLPKQDPAAYKRVLPGRVWGTHFAFESFEDLALQGTTFEPRDPPREPGSQ
jgi:hypothetical protein